MIKSISITKSGNLSLDNFFKIRKKDRYIVNLRKKVLKILETDGTLLIKNFKIENKYHENQKKNLNCFPHILEHCLNKILREKKLLKLRIKVKSGAVKPGVIKLMTT